MRSIFLLALAGCDDTIYGGGGATTGTYDSGYAGVVQIFGDHCTSCHGSTNPTDGLDLETDPCVATVDVMTDLGAPLVAPGDSSGSVLWNKMANTGTYGGVMPPAGAVDSAALDIVTAWIDDGALCGDTGTP